MLHRRHPDFPPERPRFFSPEAYLDHVASALERWREPWPPATKGELQALATWYPELAKRWIPTDSIRRHIGLPHLGRHARPWGEHIQERMLATLITDREFAAAVRVALGVQG